MGVVAKIEDSKIALLQGISCAWTIPTARMVSCALMGMPLPEIILLLFRSLGKSVHRSLNICADIYCIHTHIHTYVHPYRHKHTHTLSTNTMPIAATVYTQTSPQYIHPYRHKHTHTLSTNTMPIAPAPFRYFKTKTFNPFKILIISRVIRIKHRHDSPEFFPTETPINCQIVSNRQSSGFSRFMVRPSD